MVQFTFGLGKGLPIDVHATSAIAHNLLVIDFKNWNGDQLEIFNQAVSGTIKLIP